MSESVLKHQDDDGNLSVFASGDVVVLSCEHGHYWVLSAKQQTNEGVREALDDALPALESAQLYNAL